MAGSKGTESFNLASLFYQTYEEALNKNEENYLNWIKSREDHSIVLSLLETLPDKLSCDVMVPIGSKALMPGKIVHTNEILVCLGAGWFVKQSAKLASEICKRRVSLCNETLSSLEKEKTLLTSRKELPFAQEVFCDEIKEPYVEEEETKWRALHKGKVKDYHQQMKEQRTDVEQVSKPDEELWKHLDLLQLEEELQQELDVLHTEHPQTESSPSCDVFPVKPAQVEDSSMSTKEDVCMPPQLSDDVLQPPRRRVSFVQERSIASSSDDEDDSDPFYIHFSHSSSKGSVFRDIDTTDDHLLSPADIFKSVPEFTPKSILKLKCVEPTSNIQSAINFKSPHSYEKSISGSNDRIKADVPIAFGNVVERVPREENHETSQIPSPQPRPESRFRANRKSTARTK